MSSWVKVRQNLDIPQSGQGIRIVYDDVKELCHPGKILSVVQHKARTRTYLRVQSVVQRWYSKRVITPATTTRASVAIRARLRAWAFDQELEGTHDWPTLSHTVWPSTERSVRGATNANLGAFVYPTLRDKFPGFCYQPRC
jgi:hypothetical protein